MVFQSQSLLIHRMRRFFDSAVPVNEASVVVADPTQARSAESGSVSVA
jgi:hypothetical protein